MPNGVTSTGEKPSASGAPASWREGSGRRRLKLILVRLGIFLAVAASLRYFHWRVLDTMNPAAMWFSYLFLAAEALNFLETALFFFTVWKPSYHVPPAPLPDRTVDVFITTYNESLSLLRETAVCAVSMRYPHRTYILDDGNRPEVRELARELGCGYFARTERTHAKAGNLNNALAKTEGEFIVTLDADHVPMPDFIDHVIGFFSNPAVAAVQTAQDFYNLDSFQHLTDWRARYAWQQQELFFSVVQPGKDGYNATFYCGSPAVLRRAALQAIGGFATETVTEDMHTGLRLQRKGWRLLYYNRTLARGLAPQTFTGFANQWQRWGHGAMQVLRCDNPLWGKGLSFGQRVCYFASFYFYWMSYQKLFFVLTPLFSLLTGIFPLVAGPEAFVRIFGPYFIMNVLVTASLQGGLQGFLRSEQFNLIKLHVVMKTIRGLFRRESSFSVTPKARSAAPRWSELWPQWALIVALPVAMLVGVLRLLNAESGYPFWALTVNLYWAFFYLALTVPVLKRALTRRELRNSYRFPSQLQAPVDFASAAAEGPAVSDRSYARNLNRFGFSVTCDYGIPLGTLLAVELDLRGRRVRATGRVVRNQEHKFGGKKRFANGIQFEEIDPIDQDEISKYLFWVVAPQHGHLLRLTQATQAEKVHA